MAFADSHVLGDNLFGWWFTMQKIAIHWLGWLQISVIYQYMCLGSQWHDTAYSQTYSMGNMKYVQKHHSSVAGNAG